MILTTALVAALLVGAHSQAIAQSESDACPSDLYSAAARTDADTVYFWNDVLLEAFRRQGGGPTPLARAAAMMHVGVFDVFNSVYFSHLEAEATDDPISEVCGWEPYTLLFQTSTTIDADLAAGYAARNILRNALPGQAVFVNQQFDSRHTDFQHDAFSLGTQVANQVIALRSNDGSTAPMPYTPDGVQGSWRPTEDPICPDLTQAVTPDWGLVDPFTLASGDQFRPDLPGGFEAYNDLLESEFYADQWEEVYLKGRYDADEQDRGEDEEELAWFWANDLDGTYKPPGQHLDHTEVVARLQPGAVTSGDVEDFNTDWSQQGIRVARLFAQMSLGLADAGIAAWDSKYQTDIDLWRPVTAIHEGDEDGNEGTFEDDQWQPLSRTEPNDPLGERPFSPCFPAWVSGHATFGAAWAQILEDEFHPGVDFANPFPLELGTEDPHAVNVTRTFGSFDEAAVEDANSRVYLGVHFPIDADDGHTLGRNVADNLTDTHLRYNQTCPGWTCFEDVPAPPANFVIDDCVVSGVADTIVWYSWEPVQGATGYRLYSSGLSPNTATEPFIADSVAGGSVSSSIAVGLFPDAELLVWMTTVRDGIESGPSDRYVLDTFNWSCEWDEA